VLCFVVIPAVFITPFFFHFFLLRSIYLTPHVKGVDLGDAAFKIKLVGSLSHGNQLTLHLVPPWIHDDANLSTTLLLDATKRSLDARHAKHDTPKHAPRSVRWQLDGVSSNWGKVTFALAADMAGRGIFENLDIVRNPVGRWTWTQEGSLHCLMYA